MNAFLYTLILLGSIQGVIICGLLLFSKRRVFSNRLLAAIIGLISLPGFHLYFHFNGWVEINSLTRFVHDVLPMVMILPIGPLIYFYIRSFTDSEFRLGKREKLQFLPVIIDLLPKIVALIMYVSIWIGRPITTREELMPIDDLYNQYADIPRWISLTVYVVISVRYLDQFRRKAGPADEKIVRWLRLFTGMFIGFQTIWFFYLIPYILPAYTSGLLAAVDWFPLYIPMTILVYWLGIQGYITSLQLNAPKKINDTAWVEAAWKKLSDSMERDELYLDPELNLEKVAAHTGLPSRQISELLNQYRSTNFNSFINHYRVEEFKRRLKGPEADQLTMAGLAMKCGFNSPASFQRIFKQFTGMPPSAFLQVNKVTNPQKTG